jgi:outer membrane protein TolC
MNLMRANRIYLRAGLWLTLLGASQGWSETNRPVALEDCFQIALEHNLQLKIERLNPEIAHYNLSLSYAPYDPQFSIGGQHNYALTPGGYDANKNPYAASTSDSDEFRASLRGMLPTGFSYDLSASAREEWGTRASSPFEVTSGNLGLMSMSQPLLKNFWIDSTRMSIQVSKKNLKSSELGLRFQIMTILSSVEQAYYDLIYAQDNVKVQEKALELAERLLHENKQRVKVGALAPLDEKQAESQVAARKADVLSSQRILTIQQNSLKSLLSDDFGIWSEVRLVPTESLQAIPQAFSIQDSWAKGMTLRPDLTQARIEVEKQDIVLRYQRNQLYPSLDLVGSYGHNASEPSYGDVTRSLVEGNGPFWSYGAQLSLPIGNRAARNNYKIGKAQKQQILLQLKKQEQDIMVLIDNAVKLAQSNLERVDATRQARLYAESALEAEQKKLENGKSTSFVVLQLQRDLTEARSMEISALAEYNKALAALSLAEGTTLERHQVKVEVK